MSNSSVFSNWNLFYYVPSACGHSIHYYYKVCPHIQYSNIRAIPIPTTPPSIASSSCTVIPEYNQTHECMPESTVITGSFSEIGRRHFTYEVSGPGCKKVKFAGNLY